MNEQIAAAVFKKALIGLWRPSAGFEHVRYLPTTAVVGVKTADGKQVPRLMKPQCKLLIRFDDSVADKDSEFESGWSQFLYSTNLLQFVDASMFITENGCDGNIYNWITMVNLEQKRRYHSTPLKRRLDGTISSLRIVRSGCYQLCAHFERFRVPCTFDRGLKWMASLWQRWSGKTLRSPYCFLSKRRHREMLENEGWLVFDLGSTEAIDAIKGDKRWRVIRLLFPLISLVRSPHCQRPSRARYGFHVKVPEQPSCSRHEL